MERILVEGLQNIRVVGFDLLTKGADGQDVVIPDALVKIASGEMEVFSGGEPVSITDIMSASNLSLDQVENVFLENILTESGSGSGEGTQSTQKEAEQKDALPDETELRLQQLAEEAARLEALKEDIEAKEEALAAREKQLDEDEEVAAENASTASNRLDGALNVDAIAEETSEEGGVLPNPELAEAQGDTTQKSTESGSGFKKILPQPQIQQVVVSSSSAPSSKSSNVEEKKEEVKLTVTLSADTDSGVTGDFITNVAQGLTFVGTSNPGASISMSLNGAVELATADNAGAWSVTIVSTLPDGTYTALVTTTTLLGGTATTNKTLVIDTQSPVQPDARLSASSDTGDSDTDTITFDSKATFIGQGEANTTIELTIDGRVYKEKVGADGQWSMTVTTALFDEIDKEYQVVSVDVAGNRSAELTATLTVDTQLNFDGRLTALLDSNVVGDDITNQVNPTFSGTGDDAAAVVLVLNGLEWQTNVGRDGAWFIDPEMQLEDGRYEYSLTSKDLAGNTKTLASTLVIDTQPPVLTARLDAESDTGNSDSDGLTKDVQPKFSGVTEAAISINLSIDGKSYQTTSDSNGDWYIQMSDSLSPGNYEYTVIAMDLAGNQTLVTHEITIDTVTSLSGGLDSASDSGVSADDYLTNVQTPLFSGSGEAQATVVVTINDTEYSTQVGMNGLWSLQITDLLEPGEYTYRILATDLAGNQSPLIEHTMTVDISTAVTAQLDTLSDSGRSDDDAVTRLTKPTLSGTGEAGARLTLTVEGDVISDNIVVDENGEWQFAFVDDLVDGRYSYQVDAVDSAGNSATTGQAFVIDTLIPASFTAAMENASDSGASSSDYITNATNPIFSGTSEADSDVTLAIYQGDNLVSSDSVRVTSSESWTLAVTDSLADGVYRFEVSAKDAAGNQTDSVSHALTIDTVAELTGGLASFSDLGQSSTDNLTKDAAPTFSGTGEAGASVSLTIGGETYTTTVNAGRDWSILVPVTLVDGAYDYQLNTVDLAGNTLSDDQRLTGRIEIDTLPPESFTGRLDAQSDSGSDSNDQLTNNTQPDFTGTVEPGSTVTLDIAGQNVSAAATVDDAGNWHVNVPLELSDAVYQYSLTAEDAAGNASLLTGEFTLDTDTQITGGLLATSDSGESDSDNLTKNTTPVFGGTAEPGASVVLTINSQNYSTVVPLSGGWAITVSDVLPEGEFDYTVVATDKAGNTAQKTGSITIDTSLFVTAKLDSASDSGESSSDALTKVNTPTISGTAEAGAVINLSIAGASYSVIANSDQSWSIDVTSPLADGDIVYTVQATDKAGNTVSVDNGLTVDTQAPLFSGGLSVGSDSGSSSLDGVTNDTRPVFSGMSEVGATVSLTIADNDYQVVVDANGEWRIAIEAVMDDGEYDYNATSIDAAGNTSTLSGRVVIDTLINFTGGLDAGSDTGSSSSDAITQATKPTFSGTGERGAQVSLEIDGATYLTTVQSNGTWAVAVDQSLADAIHAYRLISTDAAGNQKIINSSVTIDTTSPLLLTGGLSVSSDTGISYQDGVTSNTTPSFLGTVEQGAQVTMTLNGVLYDTVVDDQGSWRVDTVSALPDGQYDYQISAVDAAGNQRVLNQGLTIDTKTTLSGGLEANSDTGDSNTDKLTKLVQPEFSGNAETGAQIALTIANQTYSTTVTEAGTWLVKVTNALTDGGHDYTVTSTDIAGNQATISGNIEVDSTTAVTARLKSSSDTGESNTDGVTNSNKPTFNGTGENGASIRLDIGDESYETTVDDAGKWSLQVSQALGDGDYSYTAIATDVAGNSAQVSADITIDTQAPTPLTANLAGASDSGQSSTDNITKETTPTLQGTGEANARIVVVMDNTSFTTTVSSTGNWSLSLPERTMNGTYAYQVTQTDLAGNVSLLTRSFVLDTTAPTIQGGLVQQDDSGRSNSDSMTNVNTPTFKGIAEPSANISLLINATEYPTTADSNGNWSVQVTEALPDGDFDYVISAEDVAGNSASINGAMTVDTISPLNVTAVLEQSSDTGASFDDNLTKATMPFIAGTAETGAQVVLTLNGQQYSATASSGVWRVQVSESLSDGEHSYSVVATDAAGNQTQPVTGSFIVDTSTFVTGGLLASSDTGISNSDNLTQIDTPTFVGTTEVGASVVLVINGYSYEAMVDTQGNWQVEIPAAQPLSEGGHSYTMTATDLAGNAAVTTNTVVVDTTSPTPFTLTLAQASDSAEKGDSLTNDNTPTIVGTGEPGARIEVTAGNQVKNTTVNDSGTWSVILDSLDDGLVTIAAKAIDDAGNESTTSLDITVDTTTQLTVGLSSGSDLGFENNDGITSQTQPTFIGTAEVNATIALTINDETYTTTVDNQGNWRITVSDNLPEGDHSYRATVTDKAGNSVEANGQVTVDTTAPTPFTGGLDSASDSGISNSDKLTNVTQPTFSGTGEVGSRVRLTLDNQSKTVSVDEEGNWSITIDSALTTSGNYPYALLATDVAGNSKSLSGSFTLDTTINLTGGLDYTSDTGLSFSDGLTRDTTPTFSGSADANATVMVTVSGQEYVTTATSNGRWSLTVEQPLTDDINGTTYPYTIDATDAAGNQATQIHKNFTLDLGNPTPFQGALAANSDTGAPDGVTSDSTPTFTGIAETGSSVKIEIDGATFNATVTESGNWSVSVPFANKLSDGTHVYRLIATDKAGNESTIEDTLTIDTLAPALTATLSTASDSGDANNDGLTNITTPSFNGTTQPGALVELTINGVSYLASMQDNGNWTAQVTNALAQDDYHYVVTASDLAGNISTISGDIKVDIQAPQPFTASLSQTSDSGNSDTDKLTNVTQPTLSGTGEVGSHVRVTIAGGQYVTDVDSSGVWSVALTSSLSQGEQTFSAIATDAAGNSTVPVIGSFTVDTETSVTGGLSSASDSGRENDDDITNATKPIFNGTAEIGATVSLAIGGNTYAAIVDESGNWTATVTDALSNGTKPYTVSSTDLAGNTATATGSIEIDNVAPTQDFTIRLASGSDTGSSLTDKITYDKTPTFEGTAEAGSTVTLKVDNTVRAVDVSDAGTWSVTYPELADGVKAVAVYVTDVAGNIANMTDFAFTVDTTTTVAGAMSADSDKGFLNTDEITHVTTPTFNGTGEAGATLVLTINSEDYETTIGTDGNWSVQVTEVLPEGNHDYTITATDVAGNVASDSGTATIDLTDPDNFTGGLDADSDTGTLDNDALTNDTTPTFTGTGEVGSKVTLTLDNQNTTVTVDGDGKWSITPDTALTTAGNYPYALTAQDVAGNTKQITDTFTLDLVATLSGRLDADSDNGFSDSDNLTNVTTPTFTGAAEAGTVVSVLINEKTYSTTVAAGQTTWSITVPESDALTDTSGDTESGTDYDYTISAVDYAGNTATPVTGKLTLDTSNPTPLTGGLKADADNDTGRESDDTITNNRLPTFEGTVEEGAKVTLKINGGEYQATVTGTTWTYTLQTGETLPANGTLNYTIEAEDKAGNISTLSRAITVDTTNPEVTSALAVESDSGVSNSDDLTNDTTPTLKGTSDANADIVVTISSTGSTDKVYTTQADSDGNWSITVPAGEALSEGEQNYTVKATDVAGNTTTLNGDTFTVDTTAPTTLTTDLATASDSRDPRNTTGTNSDGITNDTTPTLTGTVEAGSTVQITINNNTFDAVVIGTTWSYTPTADLPQGTYNYRVVATDVAGNSTAAETDSFTIDTQIASFTGRLQAASDTGDSNADDLTKTTQPTFAGNVEAGSVVILSINGQSYNATVDANGNWTVKVDDALSNDTHDYTLTAVDVAGNEQVLSGSITVDTQAPTDGFTIELDPDSDSADNTDKITLDNTPTVRGKGEAGATVKVLVDSQTKTATVDENGDWSITLDELSDNDWTVAATLTDPAGNVTPAISTSFTVDTTTTVAGAMSADSDKGFLNTDEITHVTTPTFNGTGEAGATLVLTINSEDYETTIGTDGNWSVQVTEVLPEGNHDYTITATDVAGNVASDSGTATIDLTDPDNFTGGLDADSDTGTLDNDALTNDTTPTFTGTGEVGSKVTLNLDGQNTTVTVDENGEWSITPDAALTTAGNYPYTLTAQDVAGNTKQITDTFTLDLVATLSGRLDADSDNGFSDSDNLTNVTTPTFTGAAEAGTVVSVLINEKTYSTTVAAGQTTWSITVPESDALTDTSGDTESGTDYDYTISAVDYAGNTATPVTGKLTLDTSNPTPLTGGLKADADNDTGRESDDTITNNRLPTFEGTVEEGAKVTLKINGGEYQATVTGTTWTYTLQTGETLPANGTLNYTIEAEDKAGNISTLSRAITVDTTNPEVTSALAVESDSGVSNSDDLTNDTTPTLKGTSDANADIVVTISSTGSTDKVYTTQADSDGNWSITVPAGEALSEGEQNYTVKATDVAGNTTTLNGDTFTVDTTAPTTLTTDLATASDSRDPRNTTGTNSDGITNDTTPTLTGTVEAGSTVQITINNNTFDAVVIGTTWSYTPTADLPQGTYNYRVVATDVAGKQHGCRDRFVHHRHTNRQLYRSLTSGLGHGRQQRRRSHQNHPTDLRRQRGSGFCGDPEHQRPKLQCHRRRQR